MTEQNLDPETDPDFLSKRLVMPEIAAHLSCLMAEEGITLADLLAEMDERGDNLFKERYLRFSSI